MVHNFSFYVDMHSKIEHRYIDERKVTQKLPWTLADGVRLAVVFVCKSLQLLLCSNIQGLWRANRVLLWLSSMERLWWSKRELRGHTPSVLCHGKSGNNQDLVRGAGMWHTRDSTTWKVRRSANSCRCWCFGRLHRLIWAVFVLKSIPSQVNSPHGNLL